MTFQCCSNLDTLQWCVRLLSTLSYQVPFLDINKFVEFKPSFSDVFHAWHWPQDFWSVLFCFVFIGRWQKNLKFQHFYVIPGQSFLDRRIEKNILIYWGEILLPFPWVNAMLLGWWQGYTWVRGRRGRPTERQRLEGGRGLSSSSGLPYGSRSKHLGKPWSHGP